MPDLLPGARVHVDHQKWDGSPHWQNGDGRYLGTDQWGRWIGVFAGARIYRQGHEFTSDVDSVAVLPSAHWWAARFYDRPPAPDHDPDLVNVYVDICSVPQWHLEETPVRLSLIDLDLDVIRCGETTFIDDEDEFAEHQVSYGYPAAIVQRAEATAGEVLEQVTARTGPFATGVAERWFAALLGLPVN
ncbi:DUF402 domain-containing protein [Demetria terragena]|uniref:DUF402 domain-containing protein n=1 Tax=Demetria terragena TaxID=63959 RepID=UPI000375FF84|nr:DUF402 domain-containing protein [Demetria terragena]